MLVADMAEEYSPVSELVVNWGTTGGGGGLREGREVDTLDHTFSSFLTSAERKKNNIVQF